MVYRNSLFRQRKYSYANNSLPQTEPTVNTVHYDSLKLGDEIPLPNVKEPTPDEIPKNRFPPIPNPFKNGITLEEIVLIGLILLIIDEHIQDEFLLIMLLYIFLI